MKNRFNGMFSSLFFLGALLVFGYGLLEFREDYLSMLGLLVVVLIAGYLFLDAVRTQWTSRPQGKNSEDKEDADITDIMKFIKEQMEEYKDIQKANYVAVKKNTAVLEEKLEVLEKSIERLANEQESNIQLVIKYNRENAKQIVLNFKKEFESIYQGITQEKDVSEEIKNSFQKYLDRLTVVESTFVDDWNKKLIGIQNGLQQNLESLNSGFKLLGEYVKAASVMVFHEGEDESKVLKEKDIEEFLSAIEVINPESGAVSETAEGEIPEFKAGVNEEYEEEKQETEEAEQTTEEEKQITEEVKQTTEEEEQEIEEQEQIIEPEEVSEPPAMDPNKPMSQDDIAALLASLGK